MKSTHCVHCNSELKIRFSFEGAIFQYYECINNINHEEKYYYRTSLDVDHSEIDTYWISNIGIERKNDVINILDKTSNTIEVIASYHQDTDPFSISNYKSFCQNLILLL